jgi:TolB-like protein
MRRYLFLTIGIISFVSCGAPTLVGVWKTQSFTLPSGAIKKHENDSTMVYQLKADTTSYTVNKGEVVFKPNGEGFYTLMGDPPESFSYRIEGNLLIATEDGYVDTARVLSLKKKEMKVQALDDGLVFIYRKVSGFSESARNNKNKIPISDQEINPKQLRTAVIEFTVKGNFSVEDAGSMIAEWMTVALDNTEVFKVYERLSLAQLMKEHELGLTGIMDEQTIAEIGKIHGVEAIVTGSIFKFGNVISVTSKLIDVETAQLIKSGDIKVNKLDDIPEKLDELALELAER